MATIYWFDFRATLGGATDPANSVYATGNAFSSPITNGPYTAGWQAAFAGSSADDSTYLPTYPRLAGYMRSTSGGNSTTYQIAGFVSGHTYKIYIALSAISAATVTTGYTIWTDSGHTTSIANQNGASTPANQFFDASGVVRTSASDWDTNNVAVSITPSVTTLYFGKSFSGNDALFNTIGIEDTTVVAASGSATLMMMGV